MGIYNPTILACNPGMVSRHSGKAAGLHCSCRLGIPNLWHSIRRLQERGLGEVQKGATQTACLEKRVHVGLVRLGVHTSAKMIKKEVNS